MQEFIPQKIIVESSVADLPLTRRIRERFEDIPFEEVESLLAWKEPGPMTPAKRILALAEQKGDPVKPFPKIKFALNLSDYVFNPISNCHLECTYCILQSYLQNNPVLTVFANTEHFKQSIQRLVSGQAEENFRLGTGELSDSLALDGLTHLSREWIPFFAGLPNAFLELKTKSDAVENLLDLPHGGHTVVSWSLSPQEIIRREELKCATLSERLRAARRVQDAGYPVGLHLDPLIYFAEWEEAYRDLIEAIASHLDPRRIAWVSMGSLRFDKDLKQVATERFPHTKIFAEDFILAPDGKMRYFKRLRIEMYRRIWSWLQEWSDQVPRYLCMEAPWMWEAVLGKKAPESASVEAGLLNRLQGF